MNEVFEKMKNIMRESCTSIEENWCDGEDKAECQWMQEIAEVGITTEAEIRAMAIDEFAEKMIIMMQGHRQDIERIAKQLKGE